MDATFTEYQFEPLAAEQSADHAIIVDEQAGSDAVENS
jgi:hypothetical protein